MGKHGVPGLGIIIFFIVCAGFQAAADPGQTQGRIPEDPDRPLSLKLSPAIIKILERADLEADLRIEQGPQAADHLDSRYRDGIFYTGPDTVANWFREACWCHPEKLSGVAAQVLAISREEGDAVGTAFGLMLQAVALGGMAEEGDKDCLDESLEAWEQSARAWAALDAGPEQVICLVNVLLNTYVISKDKSKWNHYLDEAIAVAEAETRRPLGCALALHQAGFAFLNGVGAMGPAQRLLDTALAIYRQHAPRSLECAVALSDRSGCEMAAGKWDAAEEYLNQAADLVEAVAPGSVEHAEILRLCGVIQAYRGHYWSALDLAEGALEILEILEVLSPERWSVKYNIAVCLSTIGSIHCRLDNWKAASSNLELSLEIALEYNPAHAIAADAYRNMGWCLWKSEGDFGAAEKYYRKAQPIVESLKEHGVFVDYADFLASLGCLAFQAGDLSVARDYWQRAQSMYVEGEAQHTESYAGVLSNLGSAAFKEGDLPGAVQYYREALAIQEQLAPESPSMAAISGGYGKLLIARGDLSAARVELERSLAILERLHPGLPEATAPLNQLGALALKAGDLPQAEANYRRSLDIREKDLGPDHYALTEPLAGLAAVRALSGQFDEALRDALRAESIRTAHLRFAIRPMPERLALTYSALNDPCLPLALSLAGTPPLQNPENRKNVFEAVVRSRALVFDEMAARHRAAAGTADSSGVRLAEEYAVASRHLAQLAVRGPGNTPLERYRADLDQTARRKEEMERQLADRVIAFRRELSRRQAGWAEVSAAIPPGCALVSYVRYPRTDLPVTAGPLGPPPASKHPAYLVMVLRRGDAMPRLVPLGPAEPIDTRVQALRESAAHVAEAPGRGLKQAEREYRECGAALRALVWDPVQDGLVGTPTVFVVPDGSLHLVNFAALPNGPSGYLVDAGWNFHYLMAERDLLPLEEGRKGAGILALGDPAFNAAALPGTALAALSMPAAAGEAKPAPASFRGGHSGSGDFVSLEFEALPRSAAEVTAVVAAWQHPKAPSDPGTRSATGPAAVSPEVIRLIGAQASEAAFKQLAPGRQVLHLATHGFFLDEPWPRDFVLDPVDAPATLIVTGENPLLRSGLALAGANRRNNASPDEEDGILTAEEIAALDLSGVEWAVLSACDTGVGKIEVGEGAFGLRRAFQVAGARTVIMSLWPVGDEATRRWMAELYAGRFSRSLSTAQAVNRTYRTLLQERRARGQSTHPFFWAGFVAAGDWR